MDAEKIKSLGQGVIDIEAAAITALLSRIDDTFVAACRHCMDCSGRVVVIGMGKSGHIGGKIAATLASTGTPAFFVHPGEASHGDLGMITRNDVVLALSNSGETAEITSILPLIKRLGVPLLAMTGNPESALATTANVHLNVAVSKEACPLNLAPTASTTAALVMGDALAVALLEARGFTAEDFALSHPGGSLGRRLLLHVEDIMHRGNAIPRVPADATVGDCLLEMTAKGLGMACVSNGDELLGVFTDGDLRRTLEQTADIRQHQVSEFMTSPCKSAQPRMLAVEAVELMDRHAINALPVTNEQGQLIGAINMHDLLRAGVV